MLRVWTLVYFAALANVAQADAIPDSEIYSGNWSGAAFTYDNSNEFSHCVVTTGYRNGHELGFSVDAAGTVNVGVSNPEWQLTVGETFPIEAIVDGRRSFSGTAEARAETLVVLSIFDLKGALGAFKRGYSLKVRSADYEVEFDLTGTYKALDQVLECALYYYEQPQQGVPDSAEVATSEVDKTLLFQIATSMVNEAGAGDFRYLTAEELAAEGFPNAVMWESKALGLISGVFVSEVDPEADLRALSASAAQNLMAACEGDAASSSSDASTAELSSREVRVVCKVEDGGSDSFFRQVLVGEKLLETVVIFTGSATTEDQDRARSGLNDAISLEAAAFLTEAQ